MENLQEMKTTEVSDERCAGYFDLLYGGKSYNTDCDFIEGIFQRFSSHPLNNILDLGCRTGSRAIALAGRSHKVTGIDPSTPMIAAAAAKADKAGLPVDFRAMDICRMLIDRIFDACLNTNGAIGRITVTDELVSSFRYTRKHLGNDSLFVLNYYSGLSVIHSGVRSSVREVKDDELRIIRTVASTPDLFNHLCRLDYHLLVLKDDVLYEEINEAHTVRYFFPQEIAHYLKDAGFKILHTCPFLELDNSVNENCHRITIVASTAP